MFKTLYILCKHIKICHYYDKMMSEDIINKQGGLLPFYILFADLMPLPE